MPSGHPWSADELHVLDELWGVLAVQTIAKRIGRSAISTQQKGYELYGSPLHRSEDITITELARTLGIGREVVWTYWVKKHGLPYTTRSLLNKRRYRMVNIDAFWKWAAKHQNLFDTRRFELGVLGAEPSWMAVKRRTDTMAKPKTWTQHELFELRRLLSKGFTHRDIGLQIGRTEEAVRIKARRINLHPRRTWTLEQERELARLLTETNISMDEIGIRLERTLQSVRSKKCALGLPDRRRRRH